MDNKTNLEGMREAAASAKVREDFDVLTACSRRRAAQVDLNTYLRFLTFMSRLCPGPPSPRPLIPYPNARL